MTKQEMAEELVETIRRWGKAGATSHEIQSVLSFSNNNHEKAMREIQLRAARMPDDGRAFLAGANAYVAELLKSNR
jgi:hypothetical protein